MRSRNRMFGLATLLQATLFLPTALASSICLGEGRAAVYELVPCVCTGSVGAEPTVLHAEVSSECGACSDISISALASTVSHAPPLSACLKLPRHDAEVSLPITHAAAGLGALPPWSLGSPPPILRC